MSQFFLGLVIGVALGAVAVTVAIHYAVKLVEPR